MTIELDNKTFEYVRPTLTLVKNLSKKEYEKIFIDFDEAILDSKQYRKFNKRWNEFCRDIFVSDWTWYFRLPKELQLKNIRLDKVPEVARCFFDLLQETRKGIEKQAEILKGSGMQNSPV